MATPKSLKEISYESARKILVKHPEGEWEGTPFRSDFVFEGRMTKYGYRRYEMLRFSEIGGRVSVEKGVVCM